MKLFTVRNGKVTEGAEIQKVALKGAGVEIDAIVVGEEGRGRVRGMLSVQGAPADGVLRFATLGTTQSGKPKLVAAQSAGEQDSCEQDSCIVVFRTEAGYRGDAHHTGDRNGLYKIAGEYPDTLNRAGMTRDEALAWVAEHNIPRDRLQVDAFLPFPGQIICLGEIAQGQAGRMGGNKQPVAIMPAGVWFRTGYGGRLYGAPSAHYYRFDGERLLAMTWEERELLGEAG